MELYLQHFFFRIHNFKKPYNITSFNRKKALIEKEDTRNMVVLTLLPKIDILRLTKRHHKKELPSSLLISLLHLTSYTMQSRKSTPTSRSTLHDFASKCARVLPENSYSLRIGTKILRVILPSQHPLKVRTQSTQAKKIFLRKKIIP